MPKEYIEREVISEGIRKYYYKNPPNSSYQEGFDNGLDKAQRVILDAPAADVAPVVHGRWIEDHDYLKCPECGIMVKRDFTFFDIGDWNFCPNCGKKWIWRKKNETD